MLRLFDVCAGIGGFSLGLETTGQFKTVGFCEIDSYCQKVLNKHWPDVPIYTDLKELANETEKLTIDFDIISAGIPCQSFSNAGNKKGKKDDRYLWPYLFEIIKQKKPTYVLIENVANFIHVALDNVYLNLENEMYATQSFIIPACSVQAPHKRDRTWIISKNMAHSISQGLQGRLSGRKNSEGKDKHGYSGCSSTILLQSKLPTWTTRSKICGISDGVSHRMDRIKGLGNSVVPQVVHNIGLAIAEDFKREN
jgi:DNA (cytosine-5)-methyltransferase 1